MNNNLISLINFYIFLSYSMLFALEVTDEMKEQYIKHQLKNDDYVIKNNSSINNLEPKINNIKIPPSKKNNFKNDHFGYNYFLKRQSIPFYENMPIQDNYTFGPGDEIIINIWGDIELQSSYIINKNGNLFIDKLGQLSIVGKTLAESEIYLKKRFENVFSTMKGSSPSTFFDLSIGKLKSININIIGEAASPGIYSVHPFSTISTALIQTGGVQHSGTLRNIQLIRNGNKVASLDFYQFLIYAKTINDLRLKDGDIIFIPLKNSTIKIEGEVRRNAIFELTNNENLGDLLDYCGGLKVSAQKNIQIYRILDKESRPSEDFANKIINIPSTNINFKLHDGDVIKVKGILPAEQYVTITGTVKNPGEYSFIPPITIMDIINFSGGVNDSTFRKKMDLSNVEIVRRNPFNEYPEHFIININSIINGNQNNNIKLKNWDLVNVRSNKNYDPPKTIIIRGQVNSPGEYALLYKSESINDIISRAGGFTEKAFQKGLQVFRENKKIILKNNDFPLIGGEEIIVPSHPAVVQVSGAIYNPGYVQWEKNKNLMHYIDSAGGLNFNADKRKTMVIYANGNVRINKTFSTPKIEEGCHIIIPNAEEKEDLNITEFLKELSSIVASLATIIFVITSSS